MHIEDQNITYLSRDNKNIVIVGTAHVSKASAELVERTIREINPTVVCIELCEPRHQAIINPNTWQDTTLFEVLRSGKSQILLAQIVLSGFQKRIAKKFSIRPGEEMLRAIEVSKELDIPIKLIDRGVRITLRRAWASMNIFSLFKVFLGLLTMMFSDEDVDEQKIEELKSADEISLMMKDFSESLPSIKKVIIDERDQYLITRIKEEIEHIQEGETLVAVVGAGHVPGMKANINEKIDLKELDSIPPVKWYWKLLSYSFPIFFIGIFAYLFSTHEYNESWDLIVKWALLTGTGAAIGAIIGLAHPLTILSGFLSAPITAIHPGIAVGMVCALVEAYLRKPQVRDLQNISEDSLNLKGLYQNRVTKVLIIMFLANLGGTIGTLIGTGVLALHS